jgi:hypothetical protein
MTEDASPARSAPTPPPVGERLRTGLREGFRTSLKIVRFTFPLYMAVDLLREGALLAKAGALFAPAMGLFGLPGEAAFAFVAAFLLNLYAAVAILVPLSLTPFQVTQCGIMMGIAHNLVVEGAVLRSTGTRGAALTVIRLLLAAAAGIMVRGLHALLPSW